MYEYLAEVVRVIDGDTLVLQVDNGFRSSYTDSFRLYGINAPEQRTRDLEEKRRGIAATEFLKSLLPIDGLVRVRTFKDRRGKYGRYLAQVFIDDSGTSVNDLMVEHGHAVPYMDNLR